MKSKLLQRGRGRTFALVFETGDDAMKGLVEFARAEALAGSQFTAIGAFSDVTLGYFDWERRDYRRLELTEQVEVLSLVGDVTRQRDEPRVHAHVVLGRADGAAHGGHLFSGRVRPTLEVVLTETPVHLRRRFDPASGLALIDLEADLDAPAPAARRSRRG